MSLFGLVLHDFWTHYSYMRMTQGWGCDISSSSGWQVTRVRRLGGVVGWSWGPHYLHLSGKDISLQLGLPPLPCLRFVSVLAVHLSVGRLPGAYFRKRSFCPREIVESELPSYLMTKVTKPCSRVTHIACDLFNTAKWDHFVDSI